jgi:hypothetical protein
MAPASHDDPRLVAVAALDEFIAQIVSCAHRKGVAIPPRLFDWASGEGTWVVERFVLRSLPRAISETRGLHTALRCAVRHWVAPYIVARFEQLRQLFPELEVQGDGPQISVVVRTGRWRCRSAGECGWKLCER